MAKRLGRLPHALQKQPDNYAARLLLADALSAQNHQYEAVDPYQERAWMQPSNPKPHRAAAWRGKNRRDEALVEYRAGSRLGAINPADVHFQNRNAFEEAGLPTTKFSEKSGTFLSAAPRCFSSSPQSVMFSFVIIPNPGTTYEPATEVLAEHGGINEVEWRRRIDQRVREQ